MTCDDRLSRKPLKRVAPPKFDAEKCREAPPPTPAVAGLGDGEDDASELGDGCGVKPLLTLAQHRQIEEGEPCAHTRATSARAGSALACRAGGESAAWEPATPNEAHAPSSRLAPCVRYCDL